MTQLILRLNRTKDIFFCLLFFNGAALARDELPKKEIRIGIGAMISPKEAFSYYIDLVDYIGEKLGLSPVVVQRKQYAELDKLLEDRQVDTAFVCAGPYVTDHNKFGLEILAVPQVSGQPLYYAYIVVHKNSPIKNFAQLRQKAFAFTDPNSNTGKLVPTYMLAKINETPESYFKSFIYTFSHDNSIKAVAEGTADGASIDSLIYDYIKARSPSSYIAETKIIEKSEGYGIPPFVCHPGLEPTLKAKIKEILLNMHRDDRGKNILSGIMIERFVEVEDSLYNSVRKMQEWVERSRPEK